MSASEETSRLHAQAQPVPVPPAQESGDSTVPAVSVVIPSYNHARVLGEAIESVLAQTMPDLELIVLDDGSSDESIAIAEAIAARDGRVKVHAQPNAGSHETINRGLAMARAPWLAILNSDDVWATDRLERMLDHARASGANFLFSDSMLVDGDGTRIDDPGHWWNYSVERLRDRVRTHGVRDGLLYGNLAVSTSNFLMTREVLASVGTFRRFRYNLDWDYVLRGTDTPGVQMAFLDAPLLLYRLHGANTILGGMPAAAAEAQLVIRQTYRRRLHAPESLLLSHHRHDRLLRRFLTHELQRYRGSLAAMELHRDEVVRMLHERQAAIEAERRASEQRHAALGAQLDQLHDRFIAAEAAARRERARSNAVIDAGYRAGVELRAQRDIQRCREVRMIERLERVDEGRRFAPGTLLPAGGLRKLIRSGRHVRDSLALLAAPLPPGRVLEQPRPTLLLAPVALNVAAHLHVYYLDLAEELVADALRIEPLRRIVVTSPWAVEELEPFLVPARARGVEVEILQVPNRGKDVGGLLAAIRDGRLLDSDLVFKVHSKKSQNPASYFDAISAVFGKRIDSGEQWRRGLIDPLAGTAARTAEIVDLFQRDAAIGMVGARTFVTSAPDANAELCREIYARFQVRQGLPFVAGTMFWSRSALLKPLLDHGLGPDDFSLDSGEVEGGLEHVMERMLGAMVLERGFDLLGVDG